MITLSENIHLLVSLKSSACSKTIVLVFSNKKIAYCLSFTKTPFSLLKLRPFQKEFVLCFSKTSFLPTNPAMVWKRHLKSLVGYSHPMQQARMYFYGFIKTISMGVFNWHTIVVNNSCSLLKQPDLDPLFELLPELKDWYLIYWK